MATGSPPDARQAAGSIDANRSAVGRCQDQRRFSIRPCSAASGSGRVTRTVNRRIAFTARPYPGRAATTNRLPHVRGIPCRPEPAEVKNTIQIIPNEVALYAIVQLRHVLATRSE